METIKTTQTLPTAINDLIARYKRDPKYGEQWRYGETAARRVSEGVANQDYKLLSSLKYRDNAKFSRAVFTLLTGIKLPKTQRDAETQLKAFCTPESIAAHEFEQVEKSGKAAAEHLRSRQFSDGEHCCDGVEFWDRILASGFKELKEARTKQGRIVLELRNRQGTVYALKDWNVKAYVRYALALLERTQQADPTAASLKAATVPQATATAPKEEP